MRIWLAIVIGSVLSVAALWCTSIPLGLPGEWTWERSVSEPDLVWNLGGGVVAAGIFVAFVVQGWRRLDGANSRGRNGIEVATWLLGLTAISFGWLWIVQELTPIKCRLGKAPFVLYYASSSGYFTRARYDEPGTSALLAGYEDLMREGDVLHTGTHPPGLFVIFHGLIAVCESSPRLSAVLDATQPFSFREACDVIAANSLRRSRPLFPLDRRVLWLATLLVMLAASLAVIPLYGLLRRSVSSPTAWVCAALWPAMPAVAIFIPKSDTVFPLVGLTMLWLWLTAWDRRSVSLAMVAGVVAWGGLFCSLAFLPVLLVAGMITIGSTWSASTAETASSVTSDPQSAYQSLFGIRRWACVIAAGFGFAIPILLLFHFAKMNLLNVWWSNYHNHAGFYRHYARTYWKWLLINPVELSCAAGWPVALLAIVACWRVIRPLRIPSDQVTRSHLWEVVGPLVSVWGLLWLTGKNSGEAARIWILFLPWLIWIAGFPFEALLTTEASFKVRQRHVATLLVVQLIVCLLTVARVSGFHPESG